jgi:hypothetical protein
MSLQNGEMNKPQSAASSTAPAKSGASSAASAPEQPSNDSSNQYAIMPSMLYLLVQAMLDGSKSWLEQMKEAFDFTQKTALTMIGGEEKSDGSWIVDMARGFVAMIAKSEVNAGKESAKATRMDALGSLAAGGASTLGAAYVGGMGLKDTFGQGGTRALDAKMKDMEAFKTGFENNGSVQGATLGQAGSQTAALSPDEQTLLEQWKGNQSFDFKGDVNPTLAGKVRTENGSDAEAVRNNIKTKQAEAQAQLKVIQENILDRTQKTTMATTILTNGGTATTGTLKADAQEAQAKETATAEIFQGVAKTTQDQLDDLKKQAASYNDNAGQQAASIGSFGGGLARA